MAIQAVIFDIGDVLENNPRLGRNQEWESRLHLEPGEIDMRLSGVWRAGSLGMITEAQVHERIGEIMGWDADSVQAYMDDFWKEYLGTLNVELTDYFRGLHGRYRTAIISNSFVGAREREMALFHFDEMTELIIYSHEVGLAKPDPRIYMLACERLGLAPSEVLFVDDREDNAEGARQLGIHCIVNEETGRTVAQIEALLAAEA